MLTPGGIRYDRKTVSGRHVEFVYKPLADGGLLGVHRDITELKDREQAVEQARSLMQSVLDNMSDGVTLFDPDFRMKFTNQALIDFIKLSPEMAQPGVSLLDILRFQAKRGDFGPAEQAEELARSRFEFIAKPGGAYFERRTAEGLHLEFRFVPLSNGDTIVVTRDITTLKDREDALAVSKEAAEAARDEVARTHQIMQTVFDNLIDGVSLFDKDFRWVFSNRQHREQHRYTSDVVQPGDTGYKLIRRQIDNGEYGPVEDVDAKVAEIAGRMRKPGGNRYERKTYGGRYVEYVFRELEDGGLLGVYHDITELREREAALAAAKEAAEAARAEAEAATQAKSTFLATMSHEIRTPMNGVLGMMEVLEYQGLDESQRKSVSTMRDSAQALLRIIDDLLDFSKIEAGRLELEDTAFSLSGLIDGSVETFRPQAAAKGLTIESFIEAGSNDALVGDPTRVRQILFNLVSNALKFTQRGGVTVRAGTRPLGQGATRVTLAVTDTGIGLSAEQRARLFQPFAQADSSTTRKFGGTGLGLSIVRRLTELMDGTVEIQSTPGKGSTFTVALTLKAAPADSPLDGAAASGSGAEGHRQAATARAVPRAGGRRPSGQPRGAGAPARPDRDRRGQRQRRRRGARCLGGRALQRGAGRHPHAAHGRLRADAAHSRGGAGRQAARSHADRRRHGQRAQGRGGALHRGRHGRLPGQAGEHRSAARHARTVAVGRRRQGPGGGERRRRRQRDRPLRARRLARRRPGRDRSDKDLGRRQTAPPPTVTTGPCDEVLNEAKERQKRTDHLSKISGQITCQRQTFRP